MQILCIRLILGGQCIDLCFRGKVFPGLKLTIIYLTARVRTAECQHLPWYDPVHIPVFYTLKTWGQQRETWWVRELRQHLKRFNTSITKMIG